MVDDKIDNNESENICSNCGKTIPEGSDKCPSCEITPMSLKDKAKLGLFVVGLVVVIFGAMFVVYPWVSDYMNPDMSGYAYNVTYTESGATFTVLNYFEPQDLSNDWVNNSYYVDGKLYQVNLFARLINEVKGGKGYSDTSRNGVVELYLYNFTGASSLDEISEWFRGNGSTDMFSTNYNTEIIEEKNLTVNGMPAVEFTYYLRDKDDSTQGSKEIILFIEKTEGSQYYIVRYTATDEGDFSADKQNYDLVVTTFRVD